MDLVIFTLCNCVSRRREEYLLCQLSQTALLEIRSELCSGTECTAGSRTVAKEESADKRCCISQREVIELLAFSQSVLVFFLNSIACYCCTETFMTTPLSVSQR